MDGFDFNFKVLGLDCFPLCTKEIRHAMGFLCILCPFVCSFMRCCFEITTVGLTVPGCDPITDSQTLPFQFLSMTYLILGLHPPQRYFQNTFSKHPANAPPTIIFPQTNLSTCLCVFTLPWLKNTPNLPPLLHKITCIPTHLHKFLLQQQTPS